MPIRCSPTLLKLAVSTHPILWSVRKNMQVISNRYPWSLTKRTLEVKDNLNLFKFQSRRLQFLSKDEP